MSKISKNIKKFRKLCDMTQEDLATKIHVTRQTVSSWETDRTQPDLHILQALAEVFGVEVEELIYGKKRNTAEEKEKQLFGNTLVTVLSVLGCLLIGAGVVMIFVKFWQDFPDVLKLFTCFIPALLGQGIGIYTYIKKKESLPWCEGASVLWLLGAGVTATVVLGNASLDYYVVKDSWLFMFMTVSALVLMLVFRTLSPLAVAQAFGIIAFNVYLDDSRIYSVHFDDGIFLKIMQYLLAVLAQAAVTALCFYLSSRLYKKEIDIIRHTFASWINFIGLAFFVWLAVVRTPVNDAYISLAFLAVIVSFIIGQHHTDFVSPYRALGLPVSAAALCFFGITFELYRCADKWVAVLMLAAGLVPFVFLLWEKTRPKSIYLRVYAALLTGSLLLYNVITLYDASIHVGDDVRTVFETFRKVEDFFAGINFLLCLAGLIMLVIYGAKERKLIYLNLGFILSCVTVIARLYLLDLGLIVTGLLLIACGAGLLAINLKISRLREKERLADLCEGEEEEQ